MVERKFMLDTNILIAMFKGENGIQERLVHEGFGKCVVSDISLGELYVGAFKTGNLAIDNNCLLVTDNGKHFNRIPNLDIRNWFEEHRR